MAKMTTLGVAVTAKTLCNPKCISASGRLKPGCTWKGRWTKGSYPGCAVKVSGGTETASGRKRKTKTTARKTTSKKKSARTTKITRGARSRPAMRISRQRKPPTRVFSPYPQHPRYPQRTQRTEIPERELPAFWRE